MLKILGIIAVGLVLMAPAKMFQSVNQEEAMLVQEKDKTSCARCGMNLIMFYKTNHCAIYDGKNYQYCSLHCFEDHLGEGIRVKNPKVVDVASLMFIDVMKAYYVVGSKKRATMSKVSKYAFLNESDAKEFQAQNGGEIMDFYKALEVAREDFRH